MKNIALKYPTHFNNPNFKYSANDAFQDAQVLFHDQDSKSFLKKIQPRTQS